jgi:hypothetical protein
MRRNFLRRVECIEPSRVGEVVDRSATELVAMLAIPGGDFVRRRMPLFKVCVCRLLYQRLAAGTPAGERDGQSS